MAGRQARSQDFARYVPYSLTKRSDHLGWQGFRVDVVRGHSAGELTLPPLDHHLLNLIVAVPTFHEHRWDGAKRSEVGQEGAASLVPAGLESYWHWNYVAEGTPCDLHLLLDPAFVRRVAVANLDELAHDAEFRGDLCFYNPALRALALLLLEEVDQDGVHGPLFAESIATSLVALLLRTHNAHRRSSLMPRIARSTQRLRLVCDYIEDNLGGDLHLEQLGHIAGVGPDYFGEIFRVALGRSPYRYVVERRIERSKHLLRATALSITEIAGSLGFSDHAHFSATFRRSTGITPSRFRREALR